MHLRNGHLRCRYGKLLDGVHPNENIQAEWKNTLEKILTKTGNPSKKFPKLSHRQPHPVPLIMMTLMGKTMMPARKGVGSTSDNVSTSANVWVNVSRLWVCREQPASWPLLPGWEADCDPCLLPGLFLHGDLGFYHRHASYPLVPCLCGPPQISNWGRRPGGRHPSTCVRSLYVQSHPLNYHNYHNHQLSQSP